MWTVVVAVVAAAARVLTLAATSYYRPIHDDASYARIAKSIVVFGRFPIHHIAHVGWVASSYRPPGWPVALAGIWSLTGVDVSSGRVALLALGVATCVLGAHVARRVAGKTAGVIAGLALAVDPLLLAAGASLESEALCTALILGALLAALRARERSSWRCAVLAGALIGAAALTRTNAIALIPAIAWAGLPSSRRVRWPHGAAVMVTACLVIVPWTVRNELVLHHFVPVSTEAGNTLAGTYNTTSQRHHARWLEPRKTGAYRQIYRRYVDGPALDEHLISAVAGWALQHPTYPFVALGWNSARLLGFDGPAWAAWSLHTMSLDDDLAVPIWLATMLITLLAGIELLRRRPRARGIAPIAVILLLSTAPVTGEMRLAVPLQTMLVILGSCAIADFAAHRLSHARRGDAALA